MLYFRVKFEANNEPMYLGTRRGIEMEHPMQVANCSGSRSRTNSLNYDFLIPVNVNHFFKTRMMGPYRADRRYQYTPWMPTRPPL